eukprot:jgi/Botrbrau1/5651/Bobra.55_1s0039.1
MVLSSGGEEEINVTDRSFRLRSSSSIFKVPFGTKQGPLTHASVVFLHWDISRPQVPGGDGKRTRGGGSPFHGKSLRGMVSNALAAIIK